MEIKTRIFTGIGSRKTPKKMLELLSDASYALRKRGFILRSGHSVGADLAFEKQYLYQGISEIYLPWKGFGGSTSKLFNITQEAMDSVNEFHPVPNTLSNPNRKLLARNYHQLFGYNGIRSDFVVCWTNNGLIEGGTGHTLKIAEHYNIPIFNFGKEEDIDSFFELLKEIKEYNILNNLT